MSAKRRIFEWKLRWRQSSVPAVDLGVPRKAMDRILHRTMTELRELAAQDEAADARPIINKAIDELAKYGDSSHPSEEAMMERCLEQLPARDLTILRHFKQGRKHREIAALMGTDVESVRRSLVKTYADLRMKMMNKGGGGGGESIEPPQSQQSEVRRFGSY